MALSALEVLAEYVCHDQSWLACVPLALLVAVPDTACCPYLAWSTAEARAAVVYDRAALMKHPDDPQRRERGRRRAHLMERLQRGDGDACRLLLDDIGPGVMRFLRGRVAADEIEDIYQEIFMALFQARHTYEPGRPLEPWLFAIARNIASDHVRRTWSRASWEELTGDPPESALADTPAPEPDIEALLLRLPAAQREAFAMLKLDGLTLEMAAERAGVSVAALKVRAHRAYKTLKKMITGEGG